MSLELPGHPEHLQPMAAFTDLLHILLCIEAFPAQGRNGMTRQVKTSSLTLPDLQQEASNVKMLPCLLCQESRARLKGERDQIEKATSFLTKRHVAAGPLWQNDSLKADSSVGPFGQGELETEVPSCVSGRAAGTSAFPLGAREVPHGVRGLVFC